MSGFHIFIAPAYSRVRYRSLNFRPSVRQHLRQSLVFSTSAWVKFPKILNTEKVQVGKDQEKAQSERDSHSKNRGGKKPN